MNFRLEENLKTGTNWINEVTFVGGGETVVALNSDEVNLTIIEIAKK